MSRITNDSKTIELNGKKLSARMDLLAIAEMQFYMKSRGNKITVPKMFEAIQEEDFFIICNLLAFCIKSCNPHMKLLDIYEDMKFANRNEVVTALIELIGASMPQSEEKKSEEGDHPQN